MTYRELSFGMISCGEGIEYTPRIRLGLLSILGMSKSTWKWVVTYLGLGYVSGSGNAYMYVLISSI